ncbi:MAG: S-methyl-5-thioribose-1-phosphate isomerase [Nitrospiraceae bacterium]|nr:S-methyl-5-thioribose-1-phosphate isomerase [Nitrospiraceae bacterium]
MLNAIERKEGRVYILDQSRLPHEVDLIECKRWVDVAWCIRELKIRGAPAIGIAAAMGVALGAQAARAGSIEALFRALGPVYEGLLATRPTAVNLKWAVDRMKARLSLENGTVNEAREALWREARSILEEDIRINRTIGAWGAQFIKDGDTILTHCNAGALATGGYGTATAAMFVAREQGKNIHVIVDETRPVLQGARLTAFEMKEAGIPMTLITDNSAGALMRKGVIDLAIVGTDRTARNGDVANKIGTYTVAVLCKEHGIPFYVAAPLSSIDFSMESGDMIPIEERDPEEVVSIAGKRIAPHGVNALNMAFDVTPAKYVTAIITELGVFKPGQLEKIAPESPHGHKPAQKIKKTKTVSGKLKKAAVAGGHAKTKRAGNRKPSPGKA